VAGHHNKNDAARKGEFMFMHRRRGARAVVALGAVLAASLVFGVSGATAGRVDPPGRQDGNQCFNASGVDLNALYGVSVELRRMERADRRRRARPALFRFCATAAVARNRDAAIGGLLFD
jgi:hypothetical protein